MQIQARRSDGSFVALVGGLPYHVTREDPLFRAAQIAGANAPLEAEPAAPTDAEILAAWREQTEITDIQFAKASLAAGLMTATEAEEWVANGALPAVATTALNAISDVNARAVARIEFRGARIIGRNNPFIPVLQAALSMTDEQVDDLFRAGLAL